MQVLIKLEIRTDGDVWFKNNDKYFKESFEEYVVEIVCEDTLLSESLDKIQDEIRLRVLSNRTKYEQYMNHLADCLKNFNYKKELFNDVYITNPVEEFKSHNFSFTGYASGNQEMSLTLSKYSEPVTDTTKEILALMSKLSNRGIRFGQMVENIRKDDVFHLSDKDFKKRLEEISL